MAHGHFLSKHAQINLSQHWPLCPHLFFVVGSLFFLRSASCTLADVLISFHYR